MKEASGTVTEKNGILYTVIYYFDYDGKRKYKWETTGLPAKGNVTKAKTILEHRLAAYNENARKESAVRKLETTGDISIDTPLYLYVSVWLKDVKNRVDVITYQGYEKTANLHVIPYFKEEGSTLGNLTRRKLQKFFDMKAECDNMKTGGTLSASSMKKIRNVVSQTLNLAIKEEILTQNVCTLIELPKSTGNKGSYMSAKDINRLLECIRDEGIYPAVKVAVSLGLRRSELLGLQWKNVDLENSVLHIRHTVAKVTKTVEKDKTKNVSSRRTIYLSEDLKNLLIGLKEEQRENRRLLGSAYEETDYVFTWPDGKPINIDFLSRKFGQLLKKHGFPRIRFHDLRHSCASILLSNGYQMKDVQELLGHAEISMTTDLYGHLDIERKKQISDTMSLLVNR